MEFPDLTQITGFDWNKGNAKKIWNKHSVLASECEEVFFHDPLLLFPDSLHSEKEDRFFVFGRTAQYRLLFIVFTIRNDRVRVISARDMTKREKKEYEKHA